MSSAAAGRSSAGKVRLPRAPAPRPAAGAGPSPGSAAAPLREHRYAELLGKALAERLLLPPLVTRRRQPQASPAILSSAGSDASGSAERAARRQHGGGGRAPARAAEATEQGAQGREAQRLLAAPGWR